MALFRKYFTPKEANKPLPYLKKIVGEILEKGKQLRRLFQENATFDVSSQADSIKEEMGELMAELEALGCFYKDWNFEIGLVDFPALIYDKEVLLCWRSDEQEILWYHSLDDGFVGRRPIPTQWLLGEDDILKA